MNYSIKKIFRYVGIVFLRVITSIIFIAIIAGVLYYWFCPENIKDTLGSISLITVLYLCLIIFNLYDNLRRKGLISAKIVSIINIIETTILLIILGAPIIGCLIGGILWLLNII